jgi:hypothetical protein
LPFLDLGMSKDQVSSVVSIDMNVGETTSRMIMPGINASTPHHHAGQPGEAGGKLGGVASSTCRSTSPKAWVRGCAPWWNSA